MKNVPERRQIIRQAIARAERLVESDERLSKLKTLNAPETVISREREIYGQNMGNVLCDQLAERLLPQARIRSSMRQARSQYLRKSTFLGLFKTRVEDLFLLVAHQEGEAAEYESKEDCLDLFEKAIFSGDQLSIVGLLANLLTFVEQDLVNRNEELPPLPHCYTIPHQTTWNS
jgi:hypothetical protein